MTEPRAHASLRAYALAGLGILTAAAIWRNVPHLSPGLNNWAESGNTAAALVEGRGFSDPFVGGTGATAWVPPGFVWVVAAVFLVAGIKTTTAGLVLLVLAVLALAAAHAVLIACIPPAATAMRRATSAAFLAYAVFLPGGPFEVTSESPLNILLTSLLLWAALEHRRAPRPRVTGVLVATAVLAPLTNAGLALATGLVLLALLWCERSVTRPAGAWRGLVAAVAACGFAVSAWTARNAVALGRFVPLKSNLWFELHLANVDSADGLPRAETVLQRMPFFSVPEFSSYAKLGELAYVETFRAPAVAALRRDPRHFAGNVARRAINAFAICRVEDGSIVTRATFTPADQLKLVQAKLLLPLAATNVGMWRRIDAPPAEAHAEIAALRLDDFPHVWLDWVERHEEYAARHLGVRGLVVGFAISGLPILALFGAALGTRGAPPAIAAWAALITVAMLLPFVLVNHSQRHQAPLLALHAAMLGACIGAWVDRRRAGAPAP